MCECPARPPNAPSMPVAPTRCILTESSFHRDSSLGFAWRAAGVNENAHRDGEPYRPAPQSEQDRSGKIPIVDQHSGIPVNTDLACYPSGQNACEPSYELKKAANGIRQDRRAHLDENSKEIPCRGQLGRCDRVRDRRRSCTNSQHAAATVRLPARGLTGRMVLARGRAGMS